MDESIGEQIQGAANAWKDYNSKKHQLERLLAPLYLDYLKFMSEQGQIHTYNEDFQIVFSLTFSRRPLETLTFEEIGYTNKRYEVPVAYFTDPEGWKQQKIKDIAAAQEEEAVRLLGRKRALYEQLKQELGEE